MAITRSRMNRTLRTALLATSLLAASPAMAQLTTATIRGQVTTSTAAAPGTVINAVNVENGAASHTTAGPDGSYVLTGLQPGTYDISFGAAAGAKVTRRVIVSVGQTASLDVDTAAPATGTAEGTATTTNDAGTIVVTGTRLVETRTSEVGTNVTQEQIDNLPQNNRNFLNFAALAPGIRVNQTEFRQTFSAGGVGSDKDGEFAGGPQVNVFIDGVSLKGNINQGGIVGQDVSRGNPFSQLAVKEFRVLTSNFKAEFEDSGTAIITAITKSGTNEFHGDLFGTYQNEHMIARDFFQKKNGQQVPKLKRFQYGGDLGGPIIRDRLFFFGSYEANIQDRVVNVTPGNPAPGEEGLINFNPQDYAGTYASPFREQLGFGKLTFLASDNQRIELSGSIRKETDNRDFGGNAVQTRGKKVTNDVYTAKLSHTYRGDGLLNEATIDYLKSDLAFGADLSAGFGLNYPFINLGAQADYQTIKQSGLTFRDNLSFSNFHWNGDHLIKIGAKVSLQKYGIGGSGPNANPQFDFIRDPSKGLDISQPSIVHFGGGNPNITAKTTQIGLFAQDDWEVNQHLLFNIGLRWDYDSNAKNNKFVTPPNAVLALQQLGMDPRIQPAFYNVNNYISTGHRKADLNNFAPRIGFSYDLNADQRTVFFGGYGRYYDRALFRNAAEESLLTQYRSGELLFSKDGLPRDGRPTIQFQPQYLTRDGFAALLASLAADPTSPGTNQLRVIPNDLKTPYTDQFSIGVRQRIGIVRTSLTFNHTIGKDQIGYAPLNRSTNPGANGFYDYISPGFGYGDIIAAFNTRATKYDAIYVTADKPYTKSSGWGAGIAYTGVLRSKERGFGGGNGFNYDYPNIAAQDFIPNAGNERHRIVANGIVDLPLNIKLSSLVTYGSGAPYFIIDANRAPPPDGFKPGTIALGFFNHLPPFLQVDMRLQKSFKLLGDKELTFSADVFNLFNRANFGGFDGNFICCGNAPPKINSLAGPPRTFQFGAAFRF